MATGKTNAAHYRLFLGQTDLSGDSRQVGSFGVDHDEADVTGWGDGVHNFTLGKGKPMLEGYQAVFAKGSAPNRSHDELSALEEYLVSLLIGIRAAPAVGDPAFACQFEQASYVVQGEGPSLVSARFAGPGQGFALPTEVFGVVLDPGTSLTATSDGASVDNGATSANGCFAFLHVVSAGGTWTFKVQHSVDNAVWTDLITFTANGSVVTAERGAATGTVNRYTRRQATLLTAGTVKIAVTFVRQ